MRRGATVIGERVNNYEIKSVLGEGGMGAVYLALHPFMGRKAAIKVLRRELAEDQSLVQRFMNEARAANAIHHPNIIDIIDVGLLPSGIPYLMMEYLEGETLAGRIARGRPLPTVEAVDVATQTAAALQAAHDKGIVHRDLKPDNLFLVPDEGRPSGTRVKVLDFGIAKLRGELSGSGAKTQSGVVMGTPPYMSPEQCRGLIDEVDSRTDIYALGIILYEMLVGAPPFVSAGWGEVVLMHVTKPVPPPRASNPEIAAALEAVILRALAKLPDDRWPTMDELNAALRVSIGAPPRGFVSGFNPNSEAPGNNTGTRVIRTPTTLGTSNGELAPERTTATTATRQRRSWALLAGGGALAATAVALIVATRSGPRRAAPGQVASPAAAMAAPPLVPSAATPPAPPIAPPPAAPPEPVAASAPAPSVHAHAAEEQRKEHLGEPHKETGKEIGKEPRKEHRHKHALRDGKPHDDKEAASAPPPAPAPATPTAPAAVPARPKPVEKW